MNIWGYFQMFDDSKTLYYNKPAKHWLEALPLGNGSIGAMVYGKTDTETVAMNSDTLWSGFPRETQVKEGAHENFLKARELTLQGEYKQAEDIINKKVLSNCCQAYMPLCHIDIEYSFSRFRKNYKRYLDLETGINTVEFSCGKNSLKRESFVSHPDNVYVDNIISANGIKFGLKVALSVQLKVEDKNVTDDVLYIDGLCPSDSKMNLDTYAGMKGTLYPEDKALQGIHYRCAVKVVTNGNVEYSKDYISVTDATYVTIIFATENSFNGYKKHPTLEGKEYKNACINRIKSITEDYETLKKAHIEDFTSLYNRVSLNIGSDNKGNVPTFNRLKQHNKGAKDIALYTLMFNFGRYLVISGSRQGTQATTLQGIWNDSTTPPWNCNYTVNINTEMNYWPVLPCNLFECNTPIIDLAEKLADKGKTPAETIYNANGSCAHHNVDIWGFCDPASGSAEWGFWPMSIGWICEHLYNHYLYTNNTEYLSETAYPVMTEAVKFYLDMLIQDKDGFLIMAPSTSPENRFLFRNTDVSVSETTTMTMSIIKELFGNYIKASDKLNISNELVNRVNEALNKLLPFKVGSKGQLLEWYKEETEKEPHHRHKSHLYGLHPANLITPDETPDLANACKRSLELRGDNGTGWSLGWKINMWARLWDGDHALKLLKMQLKPKPAITKKRGGGTYPNLFDAHPPFQIDGNYGYTSGVTEMLLQSREGKIFLLPALPTSWKSGKVTGLKAVGNITVDIEWKDGKMTAYNLDGNTENIEIFCQGEKIK